MPTSHLLSLSPIDLVVIAAYFAMVLGIGFYLKRYTQTGEDFFLAGRDMTAWIAGLSFVSANLGALELMGWAGAAFASGEVGVTGSIRKVTSARKKPFSKYLAWIFLAFLRTASKSRME